MNTDPVDLDKFRFSFHVTRCWSIFPKNVIIFQLYKLLYVSTRQDSLAAHNAYRAKHGVAALKISAELNALAQQVDESVQKADNVTVVPLGEKNESASASVRVPVPVFKCQSTLVGEVCLVILLSSCQDQVRRGGIL